MSPSACDFFCMRHFPLCRSPHENVGGKICLIHSELIVVSCQFRADRAVWPNAIAHLTITDWGVWLIRMGTGLLCLSSILNLETKREKNSHNFKNKQFGFYQFIRGAWTKQPVYWSFTRTWPRDGNWLIVVIPIFSPLFVQVTEYGQDLAFAPRFQRYFWY